MFVEFLTMVASEGDDELKTGGIFAFGYIYSFTIGAFIVHVYTANAIPKSCLAFAILLAGKFVQWLISLT